jgi:hypothetical protein
MQCAKTQYTAQRAFAAPAATWRDRDGTGDIVFVVVHDESQRSIEKVFDQFTEPGFTADETFRAANDIVTIRKKACHVGWRIRSYVENVPDIFGERERRPLKGDTQRRIHRRDGDVSFADLLALLKLESLVWTIYWCRL